MATETALRCGHCLDPIREGEAVEVAGSLVCPTCARLASPVASDHDRPGRPGPPRKRWTARLLDDVDGWCQGKWWWARIPFLLLSLWVWIRHASDPLYRSLFGGLNLGVHELGHFVFAPFGDLPGVFGGSLLQCLVPVAGMVMFLRQRDYFAVAFAWCWLATNCFEVATYAGDAVRMELPLVTPGGGHPIHDWNYLLGALGWLRYTDTIAGLYRVVANVSMAVGVAGMTWVVARMVAAANRSREA